MVEDTQLFQSGAWTAITILAKNDNELAIDIANIMKLDINNCEKEDNQDLKISLKENYKFIS